MELSIIVGLIAATLTTLSFLPQLKKIIKTKNTKGLSSKMYLVLVVGFIFWLLYGILRGDLIIISANIIALSLASFILFMTYKYRNKK